VIIPRGDETAIRCGDESLSYEELARARDQVAGGLSDSGIERGDRIALLMPNTLDLVTALLGCWALGAVAVPVNTRFRAPEVSAAIALSGAQTLIFHPDLEAAAPGDLQREWRVEPGGEWSRAASSPARNFARPAPEAPALILFTSGSTAAPKGVTHSFETLAATIAKQAAVQQMGPGDVNLISLAMCHVAGLLGQLLPTLLAGGQCVLHAGFDAGEVAAEVERSQVTRIQLLPSQLADLLDVAGDCGADLTSIRSCIAGGDRVPPALHERFRQLTGAEVAEVCGMTECFNYSMNEPFGPKRPGSIGRPTPGNEIRVVDEAGEALPAGRRGQMIVRSPSTMIGYWGNEPETCRALRDGWLQTGDVGRFDDQGWLWFVGRQKDLIIRAGSNVSPGEVEAVLLKHPAVSQACVVGVPDDRLGQRVGAWVLPAVGAELMLDQIRDFLSDQIAEYKMPEYLWLLSEMPTNPVGKIDRANLKLRAAESV